MSAHLTNSGAQMVFLIHLLDSGPATIDWSKATLPPGKKISAVKIMMKRLTDSYMPQLNELTAGDEAGEETNNAISPKASTKKMRPRERRAKRLRLRATVKTTSLAMTTTKQRPDPALHAPRSRTRMVMRTRATSVAGRRREAGLQPSSGTCVSTPTTTV